ncbi:hypothetical protein KKB44_02210 [Candidatus Micrarchaeota archaeon]|nr:hypothetical protein [Candidatus Micrarchaeota archaeon]
MVSELETTIIEIAYQVRDRTIELVLAPLNNEKMLWIAVPLVVATLFMTLYFARYKKEELGWNTAFGNTMVFLFVALNIIKEMYYQDGVGSMENIYSNNLYFSISAGLVIAGMLLAFVTYFHLLPKRLAFFLFAAAPINVSVYVVMAVVYANLVADYLTILAGIVFLILIIVVSKILQAILRFIGLEYETTIVSIELPEELAKRVMEMEKEDEEKIKEMEREEEKKKLAKIVQKIKKDSGEEIK